MNNFDAGLGFTLFYFIIVAFSLFFGAFGNLSNRRRKVYLVVIFAVFWFLMTFRGYDMGNDTDTYYNSYRSIASASSPFAYMQRSSQEDGYILYAWLLSRISRDPQMLFAVTALIICMSFGGFAYKYVNNLGVFCCLFVGMLHFDFFLSAVRQGLAVALLLWAFSSLYDEKKLGFLLFGMAACFFHISSVVFLIVALLIGFGKRSKAHSIYFTALILLVAFVCGLFFERVLEFGLKVFPKYSYYLKSESMNGEPRLAVVLKIMVAALLLIIPSLCRKNPVANERFDRIGYRFSVVNIAILLMAISAPILTRFAPPFSLFVTSHYANQIQRLRGRQRLWLILLTLIAFYAYGLVIVVLKTPEWQTTYPFVLDMKLWG